jgi:CheY-like chemotaxis protein
VDILLNLLSNAVKFTTEGWVALNVVLESDRSADQGFVRFEVVDTGIGISKDDKTKLFNPLVQSDDVTEAARGAGLGLWSVRMKVRALGGYYDVTDNYPQGAIFWVSVPAAHSSGKSTTPSTPESQPQQPSSNSRFGFTVRGDQVENDSEPATERTPTASRVPALTAAEVARLPASNSTVVASEECKEDEEAALLETELVEKARTKVLIIDDQSVIRRMLRRGLEKHSIEVDEAANGLEGLEKMKAQLYDCVISGTLMRQCAVRGAITEATHLVFDFVRLQTSQCLVSEGWR